MFGMIPLELLMGLIGRRPMQKATSTIGPDDFGVEKQNRVGASIIGASIRLSGIALRCTHDDGVDRLDMTHVTKELIIIQFLESSCTIMLHMGIASESSSC
ncbi:Hypothetical predicted protein [Olea europaea subsp. europaea]|uniref:Uncharacterized protein n=1 Tax=Olea europaea subsp. europaea TaxID=158383 RepID=A0A8S0QYJ9_OLEEU|nr:Hypothetical predicted protein [Olea europaea subsp. europaea]CAA3019702.1 Hypothetical predicted protein [Olea europaea subsp. europaea]